MTRTTLLLILAGLGCSPSTAERKARVPMNRAIFSPDTIGSLPTPPRAPQKPRQNERHGYRWTDDYAWLKDESYPKVDDPEVIEYLEAENAYFESAMKPYRSLTDDLFDELKGRIKEDDSSVPVKDGEWLYHWRFERGAQYRRWYRQPVSGGELELLLDEAQRAEGHEFYRLGAFSVSPDGTKLAWGEDTEGGERFTMRFKDLTTGEVLSDAIENTIGGAQWSADSTTVVYLRVSNEWRPYQARAHKLGTPASDDVVLFEEKDTSFFVGVDTTQSREYFVISTGDHVTSESHLLATDDPTGRPRLISARKENHRYEVDHAGEKLFIRTNDTHENFRLVSVAVADPAPSNWKELIGGSNRIYLRDFIAFRDTLVVQERVDGLDQVRVRKHDGSDEHRIEFPESAYAVSLGANPEFAPDALRLRYESMVTPATVFDYDAATRRLTSLKVQEIPSGYNPSRYVTKRLMATVRDGVEVPVSIVYRDDFKKGAGAPLHLYGYGAYGYGMRPSFSSDRLSLLDRGFAYAIAHVRGGDEMGFGWYTAGKLESRTNTFNDFVDVTRFLIEEGYAQAGRVTISGGSAGGELMGAVVNLAPELYQGCVAHVPFVDVLNTMLDDSLPLTPMEWPEWGNPITDKAAFELIRSYSPYDNVEAKHYPPLLITGGLNDPRVTYWEPAKWAAKLRATKLDSNLLLLKINMGAGHAGKSGRFERLREVAEEYTFLLMVTGRT